MEVDMCEFQAKASFCTIWAVQVRGARQEHSRPKYLKCHRLPAASLHPSAKYAASLKNGPDAILKTDSTFHVFGRFGVFERRVEDRHFSLRLRCKLVELFEDNDFIHRHVWIEIPFLIWTVFQAHNHIRRSPIF